MSRIIEERECGIVVDETDPQDICEGIEKLITDPARRKGIAENGLKVAREEFNWEVQGKKLLEMYERL